MKSYTDETYQAHERSRQYSLHHQKQGEHAQHKLLIF